MYVAGETSNITMQASKRLLCPRPLGLGEIDVLSGVFPAELPEAQSRASVRAAFISS